MTIPRGRIVTLSPYQPRQTLPVRIHRGDAVDITINWVRLLRTGETPNEVLSAAQVAGRGVSISNVEFSGKYLMFTASGAQSTGTAGINLAISTNRGRTLSRSLVVRTVWEEAAIDAFIPPPPPACQLFTLDAPESGTEAGVFVLPHEDGIYEARAAYGIGDYASAHFTIDNTAVYDAELLYIGAEFGSIEDAAGTVFVIVLEGDRPRDYFDNVYVVPPAYAGFRTQPLTTADAEGYGSDGDGNTFWYWVITIFCYQPWSLAQEFQILIDCDEPIT